MARFALLLLAALALCVPASAAKYEIRWVLVHDHSAAVQQAARDFAARVEKESSGDIHVDILSRGEYSAKYKDGRPLGQLAALQDVIEGRVEICQTYTNEVAHMYDQALYVLGLPYLFPDYGIAEAVLDGPIGRSLLDGVQDQAPILGLAFTYSGGFGQIATVSREVHSPSDLHGLRLETMRSRVSAVMAQRLGFEDVGIFPEAFSVLAKSGLIDGIETTYSCFSGYGDDKYARYITDTHHFLLTTMIVVNKSFYESLPEKYRALVADAARDTARAERRENIALLAKLKTQLAQEGIKIIELSPEEKRAFHRAMAAVYPDMVQHMGPAGRRALQDIRTLESGGTPPDRSRPATAPTADRRPD